jgi:hypothetical protein
MADNLQGEPTKNTGLAAKDFRVAKKDRFWLRNPRDCGILKLSMGRYFLPAILW